MAVNLNLGVSSWCLHHGLTRNDFALTDLPRLAAQHGLGLLEICDFHLQSTDDKYLDDYKNRCLDSGVTLFTFLKDSGDITSPDAPTRQIEIEDARRAIDVAGALGAKRIRMIAGDAEPSRETLELSASGLLTLADHADQYGIRVVIENWHRLMENPTDVLTLLELTQGRVGLKLDFGNWSAPRKYSDLPLIAAKTECTHAKANFLADGTFDRGDFDQCMKICHDAKFNGPHILIYAEGGDEWGELDKLRDIIARY